MGDYQNWLVSENNQWCIVDRQMLFGQRAAVFHMKGSGPLFSYCCGQDANLLTLVKLAVWRIMSEFPETVTGHELLKHFPDFSAKPVNRCPVCLPKLFERADMPWALAYANYNPDPFVKQIIESSAKV